MILTKLELERIVNFVKENDLIAVNVCQLPEFHRVIKVEEVWGSLSQYIQDPVGHQDISNKYNGGYFANK